MPAEMKQALTKTHISRIGHMTETRLSFSIGIERSLIKSKGYEGQCPSK